MRRNASHVSKVRRVSAGEGMRLDVGVVRLAG